MSEIQLCDEQEEAVDKILNMDSRAIVLTGCAGSGKSFVVKHLLKNHPGKFSVCSTTARSALLVGGCTVDRMFSFSREDWSFKTQALARSMGDSKPFIIIDEASMVGLNMADLIYTAAKSYKKKVILVGDWAQASPTKDSWPFTSQLFDDASVINLQVNHRQSAGEYLNRLNDIRKGITDNTVDTFFKSLEVSDDVEIASSVKMFAVNAMVDSYNHNKVLEHVNGDKSKLVTAYAEFTDMRTEQARKNFKFSEQRINSILDACPLAHKEALAEGCRVIVTYNIWDADKGTIAANGDTGVLVTDITKSDGKKVEVLLDRTGKTVTVPEVMLKSTTVSGQTEYTVKGLPIRLGYSVSVHKSQGMTLPSADVDISSIMRHPENSRHGLAYVALSRTTTAEGLTVRNWTTEAIYSDPLVLPFIG